jgi:hypothetical protein
MQTSKILLVISATIAFSLSVWATDTDAQAKARQALEQQLNQPAPQTPAPPPTKSTPAPTPAPAATMAAPPTMAVPQQADPASIAKAREAMYQKMNEISTQMPPSSATGATFAPPPAATSQEPSPKIIPPPAESGPAVSSLGEKGADAAAIAKAREAMHQKMAELPGELWDTSSADTPNVAKARAAMYDKMQQLPPETASTQAGGMQFPALQGPDVLISGEKVQRLHALLQQYKADQITPEQYQSERAKILAAP